MVNLFQNCNPWTRGHLRMDPRLLANREKKMRLVVEMSLASMGASNSATVSSYACLMFSGFLLLALYLLFSAVVSAFG